jgi:hypothetical protein
LREVRTAAARHLQLPGGSTRVHRAEFESDKEGTTRSVSDCCKLIKGSHGTLFCAVGMFRELETLREYAQEYGSPR